MFIVIRHADGDIRAYDRQDNTDGSIEYLNIDAEVCDFGRTTIRSAARLGVAAVVGALLALLSLPTVLFAN